MIDKTLFRFMPNSPAVFISVLVVAAITVTAGCQSGEFGGSTSDAPSEVAAEPLYAVGQELEVEGILVDGRCYGLDRSHIGTDHVLDGKMVRACATACANLGFPAALKTEDSQIEVWILITNAALLADYMAQHVKVQGHVRSDGVLIPDHVQVKEDGRWTFVI